MKREIKLSKRTMRKLDSLLVSCQLDIVVCVLYLRQKNYDKVQNHVKQNRT